jgi:hypothetical protein
MKLVKSVSFGDVDLRDKKDNLTAYLRHLDQESKLYLSKTWESVESMITRAMKRRERDGL